MQSVTLLGKVVSDPEKKSIGGRNLFTFRFATTVKKKDESIAVWWNISAWGDYWEKTLSYVSKGKELLLIGNLDLPTTYTSKNGETKVALGITLQTLKFTMGSSQKTESDNKMVDDDLPF